MSEPTTRDHSDPLYSRAVIEMVTVANEYCRFLDKAGEYSLAEVQSFLQKMIPLLYLKSSLLPEIEVTDEEAIEHYMTEEQWESIFNILRNLFGPHDEFYYIDLQERSHNDPIKASIAECLTDAYQDLIDFLLLYQKPLRTFKENAVAECLRYFQTRYGFRLISVQAALHAQLYGNSEQDVLF
jgi:hypothetical protein